MIPALAPELVLQILEAAHSPSSSYPHPDAATLTNAALVCKSWAPLAQQLLFRDAVLLRTPERPSLVARAVPGVQLATCGPPHALRDVKADVTPRVSRASRLRAITAAAAPSTPTPRSYRSTRSFVDALEIDSSSPSVRAQGLASLVRSIHVFVAQPDQCCTCTTHFGGICPRPCSIPSPLPTGALTERHLAVLFGRLPSLSRAHIVLDHVDSFSASVTDALRASCSLSSLSLHVLKRSYTPVPPAFNANNAVGSPRILLPGAAPEENAHAAVFQLIHALAPDLDTLILDGELPRDPPPATAPSAIRVAGSRRPSLVGSTIDDVISEPAPDCALRELVWRGRLPPSPALLTWLLSAKAQGRAERRSRATKSRLEVLELCYLPPPDALADLLREHVPTLRSLRLHYFEAAHVDVVRQLLGRPSLSELVLNQRCTAAPELLMSVQAQHVAVTRPCAGTVRALEKAGEHRFGRVTVVDGDRVMSEQVRVACEAKGVAFESVGALVF